MHLTATRQTLQLMIDLHVSSLLIQLDTTRRTVWGNNRKKYIQTNELLVAKTTQKLSKTPSPKVYPFHYRQRLQW